jgi:hypothetical protein
MIRRWNNCEHDFSRFQCAFWLLSQQLDSSYLDMLILNITTTTSSSSSSWFRYNCKRTKTAVSYILSQRWPLKHKVETYFLSLQVRTRLGDTTSWKRLWLRYDFNLIHFSIKYYDRIFTKTGMVLSLCKDNTCRMVGKIVSPSITMHFGTDNS